MQKTTVRAGNDIALVKYWGKKDKVLRLPANGSIALILDSLHTTTTVEFQSQLDQDQVTIGGVVEEGEASRVIKHLSRIRELAKAKGLIDQDIFAKVTSENNFPMSTGLSSSASGFAALTIAASRAIGLELSERELSILSRQGSGSSCRCVCGGFVEWLDGNDSETSYAQTILPASDWVLRDLVVIVSEDKKELGSTEGHDLAETSPFFNTRQTHIQAKLDRVRAAVMARDFVTMGEIAEAEALEFHTILLTSQPNMLLLYPGTVAVMHAVRRLRQTGTPAYFTINTGFNIHVLTLPEHEAQVQAALSQLSDVQKIIPSGVGERPRFLEEHLF